MSAPGALRADPTAVVGRRVGAFALDFLITAVLYWSLFFAFAERRAPAADEAVEANLTLGDTTWAITGGRAALFFLVFIVAGLAYWALLPGVTGWTAGKLATGIRVVRGADGSVPAGIGPNLLRQLVGVVDYFPYFLPGLTGFVIALASDGHRRLGDMAAKTAVVRREAAGRPLPAPRVGAGTTPAGANRPGAVGAGAGSPQPSGPQPGWYTDPSGEARLRWWDGHRWTEHTA